MKVLVTGASGFIGRRVVAQLAREGRFEVAAASRRPHPDLPAGIEHQTVDLLLPGAPAALVERVRPTHLVHLAWNAEPGKFWSAPDNLDWSAASLSLFRAFAASGGRRAVMAGSCAEYDWTREGHLAEGAETRPATFYGAIKDATQRAISKAGEQFGVPVAWGRVFWLFGPEEGSGRLVSDVVRSLLEGRVVETTEGRQKRDFLHVDDVAGAFVQALLTDWNGPFNIGSGRAVPVRRLVEVLAQAAGREDLIHFGARPTPPNDPPVIEANITILRDRIGYVPALGLESGLAQTFQWWRARAAR